MKISYIKSVMDFIKEIGWFCLDPAFYREQREMMKKRKIMVNNLFKAYDDCERMGLRGEDAKCYLDNSLTSD